MMMIHPDHAMLLAKRLHHTLVDRAEQFRLVRRATGTGAGTDCLIPTTAVAPPPCRPDPRRSVARPAGRHGARRAVQEHTMP